MPQFHGSRSRPSVQLRVVQRRNCDELSSSSPIRLQKVHKDGCPLRPVLSFFSAPAYKLAKYIMNIWFKMLVDFHPSFSTKNSIELSEVLTHTSRPLSFRKYYLIFLDVVGLYQHAPLQPTRAQLDKYLEEASVPPSLISDFKTLLEKFLTSNITLFTNFLLT